MKLKQIKLKTNKKIELSDELVEKRLEELKLLYELSMSLMTARRIKKKKESSSR